jgi:hypothetical protein
MYWPREFRSGNTIYSTVGLSHSYFYYYYHYY